MKKIFILFLSFGSAGMLFSQEPKTKTDTMSIILNGEHITLPVPKEGNKTTINLEDSGSIIQISVGKISKNKIGSKPVSIAPTPESPRTEKRISWFNEVDFGFLTLAGKRREQSTGIEYPFTLTAMSDSISDRATVMSLHPLKVNSGFSAGFTIREKSRPIGKSRFIFITGSRFRYSRFTGTGSYTIKEIKAVTDKNGQTTYYRDTVYSSKSGEFKSTSNSYSILFPFLISTQINEKYKIAAGMNLTLNINSSKLSENIKDNLSLISYVNPQIILFQPIIKVTRNKTSLYLSWNLSKTEIGFQSDNKITGNTVYFGMAYKLY